MIALLAACSPDPEPDRPPPPRDTGTAPACPTVALSEAEGLLTTLRAFTVSLSEEAPVALACAADDDPLDEHLLESPSPARVHELRLGGLAFGTTYTCRATPICEGAVPAEVAFTTAPVLGGIGSLEVTVDPALGQTGGYTVMPYAPDICFSPFFAGIWDGLGRPVWGYPIPPGLMLDLEVLYDPRTATIVWGGGGDPAGGARIVDLWSGDTYATAFPDEPSFHHDAKRLPDGRLLTLEGRTDTDGTVSWLGFGVRVHDPVTGRIDVDFGSQRLVDAGVLRPSTGAFDDLDPYHANSVEYVEDADGAELVVSLCFDRSIVAVDPVTAEVRWRFGPGLGWTLADAGGAPLGEDALPQCQHGIDVDGTRLLVYDNGRERGQSQAAEWELDPVALHAVRTFLWTEPGWFAEIWGDVDDLGNGRVLVTEANRCGSDVPSAIVEVDRATGAVASRATFALGTGTYRAQRVDGCDLFASTRWCAARAARRLELETMLPR